MFGFYQFLQDNAIIIVAAVVLLLWVEIFFYVFSVDKRLKKVENNPGEISSPRKSRYFSVVVITILFGALLYYLSLGKLFFESDFAAIKKNSNDVELIGSVDQRSIESSGGETSFILIDNEDNELNVKFSGNLPEGFRDAKTAVVKGNYNSGVVYAGSMLVARNAIYTVMIIVLIVWGGIVLYLLNLDNKMKSIEIETKELSNEK